MRRWLTETIGKDEPIYFAPASRKLMPKWAGNLGVAEVSDRFKAITSELVGNAGLQRVLNDDADRRRARITITEAILDFLRVGPAVLFLLISTVRYGSLSAFFN